MKRSILVDNGSAKTSESTAQKTTRVAVHRVANIDLLRGFVIVLMALDHVRMFFSLANFDPMDLSSTNPLWFMTRWITHLCAPSFILLAGMGIGYSKKPREKLGPFLLSRGIWLVFLEISIINIGWGSGFITGTTMLAVLWALGVSMIFMSIGIFMNKQLFLVICLGLILGHNLLDSYDEGLMMALGPSWSILHKKHFFTFLGQKVYLVYPLIPWVGLMGIGYFMGKWQRLREDPSIYLKLGLGLICAFVILRLGSIYGDFNQWDENQPGIFSLLSFILESHEFLLSNLASDTSTSIFLNEFC